MEEHQKETEQRELEQNQEESERRDRRTLCYGYIGAVVVALFIIFGIIWQASGKTISETGKELESRKKTENAEKKGEQGEKVTEGAIWAAAQDIMEKPIESISGAAFEASTKREELLAQRAAAEAEEAARKAAEEEEAKKEKAEEEARAKEAEKKAKAKEKAQNAAQSADAGNSAQASGTDSGTANAVPPATEPAQTTGLDAYVDEVIRLVNVERANAGLAPLSKNGALCQAAKIRVAEIAVSFSHDRPDGRSCFTVLEELGISGRTCGENIALGHSSPAEVVEGWMNSPGHRANILDSDFKEIGIGVERINGRLHWVQMFLG